MKANEKGAAGEDLACRYLEGVGFKILERNFRNRFGEIDIVAREGDFLCFVEVKLRKDGRFGQGFEAVGPRKQQKIVRMAKEYLREKEIDQSVRLDVISIDGPCLDITLIRNAILEGK